MADIGNTEAPTTPDRFGNITKDSFLIAPRGQSFLDKHKISVRDFSADVEDLSIAMNIDHKSSAISKSGITLERFSVGEYSTVYRAAVGDEKCVIKFPAHKPDTVHDSYQRHMTQKQAIATDLKGKLDALQITLPQPLFASSEFYAEELVEGKLPEYEDKDVYDKLNKACGHLSEYLKTEKVSNAALWDRTGIERVPTYERVHTMIKKPDGSLSWIAPVYPY